MIINYFLRSEFLRKSLTMKDWLHKNWMIFNLASFISYFYNNVTECNAYRNSLKGLSIRFVCMYIIIDSAPVMLFTYLPISSFTRLIYLPNGTIILYLFVSFDLI